MEKIKFIEIEKRIAEIVVRSLVTGEGNYADLDIDDLENISLKEIKKLLLKADDDPANILEIIDSGRMLSNRAMELFIDAINYYKDEMCDVDFKLITLKKEVMSSSNDSAIDRFRSYFKTRRKPSDIIYPFDFCKDSIFNIMSSIEVNGKKLLGDNLKTGNFVDRILELSDEMILFIDDIYYHGISIAIGLRIGSHAIMLTATCLKYVQDFHPEKGDKLEDYYNFECNIFEIE